MDARTTKPEQADGGKVDLAWTVHDPDALARNIARFLEEAGKATSAYLKPREEGRSGIDYAGPIADAVKTIGEVVEYWLADPQRSFAAERRLWSSYLDLWTSSLKRMAGEPAKPAAEPDPRDRRFVDPDWSRNQFFDFLKQLYLITSRWAFDMVDEAGGLDPHTREKAAFYVRQIASAVAPSNFVLTNPELLRETLSSDGENLVRGMHLLAEDIKAGDGDLRLRQSSSDGFKLGETLAVTPGKVIFQNALCQVIQYAPTTKKVLKRPLLIVPPWINKFYILDLTPEKSFIRWCVDQGQTVFVISWVNPDKRQAKKSFENYMQEGVLEAVDVALKVTGADGVNAVGYCVGGTLLSVTLAWLAARGDERIRSATLFATQVDFTHAGDLKVFVDEEQVSRLEKEMTVRGYLEGKEMTAAFNMLRPNDLIWPYFIGNYFHGKRPGAFDLLYWNSDATRMPAANHSFYLRSCYLDNTLARGEMAIFGEKLSLKNVTVPIYNLATREDHIAPARSVYYGSSFFGGDVTFVVTGSGHIAGVINPPARNKYQFWTGAAPTGDDVEKWMATAEEHPGSWWPHWQKWIEAHDDRRGKPPKMGGGKFKPIEDAPGSYVKVRS